MSKDPHRHASKSSKRNVKVPLESSKYTSLTACGRHKIPDLPDATCRGEQRGRFETCGKHDIRLFAEMQHRFYAYYGKMVESIV